MRWRRPSGRQASAVASKASSAARLAASPIACTPTGQPAAAASRTISASRSLEVISTPEPSSSFAVADPSVPSMNTLR